jgi:hypothetical protein
MGVRSLVGRQDQIFGGKHHGGALPSSLASENARRDFGCVHQFLIPTLKKKIVESIDKLPYRSFGDTIPVPTVARVHFLSPKLWYKILPALVAMLFS